jgi:organic hydroperoxide reductase OsmC/OhrA
MVLAAAIGNCLCASLLFCLRKSHVETSDIKAAVTATWVRNDSGRWRIKEIDVEIMPMILEKYSKQLERCIEIFEQFCVVSQSIKEGIEINVKIHKRPVN